MKNVGTRTGLKKKKYKCDYAFHRFIAQFQVWESKAQAQAQLTRSTIESTTCQSTLIKKVGVFLLSEKARSLWFHLQLNQNQNISKNLQCPGNRLWQEGKTYLGFLANPDRTPSEQLPSMTLFSQHLSQSASQFKKRINQLKPK